MFEIPDDDDNFWENLPLDDMTNLNTGTTTISASHVTPTPQKRQLSMHENNADGFHNKKHKTNLHIDNEEFKVVHRNPDFNRNYFESSNVNSTNSDRGELDLCGNHGNTSIRAVKTFPSNSKVLHSSDEATGSSCVHQTNPVSMTSRKGNHGNLRHKETQLGPVSNYRHEEVHHGSVDGTVSSNERTNPEQTCSKTAQAAETRTDNILKKQCKRKFPGPAGLLPKLKSGQALSNVTVVGSSSPAEHREDTMIISSQSGDDMFSDGPWCRMMEDLPGGGKDLLGTFSISASLHKASRKLLPEGKVALMFAVLETVDRQGLDASVTLKDRSGKITGTIHRDVFKEFDCDLHPGTALVLKQMSVVSPTSRTHYLNITQKNIVQIYTQREKRSPAEVVHDRSSLKETIETAKQQMLQLLQVTNTPKRTSSDFNRPAFRSPATNSPNIQSCVRSPFPSTPARVIPPYRQFSPASGSLNTSGCVPPSSGPLTGGNTTCTSRQNNALPRDNATVTPPTEPLAQTPNRKFTFKPARNSPSLATTPRSTANISVNQSTPVATRGTCSTTLCVSDSGLPHRTRGDGKLNTDMSTGVPESVSRMSNVIINMPECQQIPSSDADLWQDELSDELLSQLSEEMV